MTVVFRTDFSMLYVDQVEQGAYKTLTQPQKHKSAVVLLLASCQDLMAYLWCGLRSLSGFPHPTPSFHPELRHT